MHRRQVCLYGAHGQLVALPPARHEAGDMRMMLDACDWQSAIDGCREILDADPDHLGALEVLAQAQWFGGEFDAVVRTTSRMLRLNPLEPGYRYTRGMALLSKGDLLGAAEDFRNALAQSTHERFKAQVREALGAVEIWLEDKSVRSGTKAETSAYPGITNNYGSAYPFH